MKNTLGFRGAGSINNIAFLAGPGLSGTSVNFFAFQADTGQFLGACALSNYNYIRGWKLVDGVLYVGVGSDTQGGVLRWDGAPELPSGNFCGRFSEVGRVTADVANVTLYVDGKGQDRLAATTVPIRSPAGGSGAGVGVWISPVIPGRRPDDQRGHRLEAGLDPVAIRPGSGRVALRLFGGAVQYFDGWLYWGTIHLQNSKALSIHETCTKPYCYGMPANVQELQALAQGVYRSTSVWRGRNLENPRTREIQLLYGESQLPAGAAPKTFEMKPTGWTPLYGPSGFGNSSNEYTWQMAVFNGHLYIGTYDAAVLQGGTAQYGADLWRFDSSNSPAVNEDSNGLGDRYNYGIRVPYPLDDGSGLIAGMANLFNPRARRRLGTAPAEAARAGGKGSRKPSADAARGASKRPGFPGLFLYYSRPIARSGLRRRPADRRQRRGRVAVGLAVAGLVPAHRRRHVAAFHDRVDLRRVDGLVLEQRLRHHVQLVEVLGEQGAWWCE